MEDPEEDPLVQMGVSASLSRMYAADHQDFLDNLAALLESALPGEVTVERRGGLFAERRIRAVRIQLGDYRYSAERPDRGPLSFARTKVVRGIKLKTEPITAVKWLEDLVTELEAYAERNLSVRDALKQFIGG